MLITESREEICFTPVVKRAKTRSGGLIDKPQSTITSWRHLVAEFVFPTSGSLKGLCLLLEKMLELLPPWEDECEITFGDWFVYNKWFYSFLVGENPWYISIYMCIRSMEKKPGPIEICHCMEEKFGGLSPIEGSFT